MADQVYNLSRAQARGGDVFRVEEHDAPPVADPAIAIVRAVDRSIKLVVTANRHHQKLTWAKLEFGQLMHGELGLATRRVEDAFACGVGKIEATGVVDTRVVVVKTGHDSFDRIANLVVIIRQVFPINGGAVFERGARETRNDLRFA